MGCFRVFAHHRVADFHGVNFELDTDTRAVRLERDATPGMRGYVTAVDCLVRLAPEHTPCDQSADAYLEAIAALALEPKPPVTPKEPING